MLVTSMHECDMIMMSIEAFKPLILPDAVRRTSRFPRGHATIGGVSKLALNPSPDLVDYVLSYCGETFPEFWEVDIDPIIKRMFFDEGELGEATRALWCTKRSVLRCEHP